MPEPKIDAPDTIIIKRQNGTVQLRKRRKDGWTKQDFITFLDVLAASCNVKMACAAINRRSGSAYRLRRTDPAFADAWDDALQSGFASLETMLVERARGPVTFDADGEIEVPDVTDMDTELALKLLGAHRRRVVDGKPRGGGRPRRGATEEQTNAAILKRLRVLYRRMQRAKAKEQGSDVGLGCHQG